MKLHLGCGKRYLPGFIHADQVKYPHVDHVGDVRSLVTLEDTSVDLIYASHVIEYFDQHEVVDVLKEWRRVLKIGCICRVSVPNFDKLVSLYLFASNMRHMLGPLYGRINGREGNVYHRCAYDEAYLTDRFLAAGFRLVREWDPWEELPEDFDDFSKAMFPHMDFDKGVAMSLNLEAIK